MVEDLRVIHLFPAALELDEVRTTCVIDNEVFAWPKADWKQRTMRSFSLEKCYVMGAILRADTFSPPPPPPKLRACTTPTVDWGPLCYAGSQ